MAQPKALRTLIDAIEGKAELPMESAEAELRRVAGYREAEQLDGRCLTLLHALEQLSQARRLGLGWEWEAFAQLDAREMLHRIEQDIG
ncbi:MAG TPA: hypothetical protein VGN97_07400 [Mesorhizobium sp.]|jgi:hypothetical protein|nr:hypothetical protein [Mesorhizobium sp.]